MVHGKRFAIQAPDSLGCFISATIGTAGTFHCGPWRCIEISGRAGRGGRTKYGSRYLSQGAIEPIVEHAADVIRWHGATPFRIYGESRRHLRRDSLGTPGCPPCVGDGSHRDHRRNALSYWPARGLYILVDPNRCGPRYGGQCCEKSLGG